MLLYRPDCDTETRQDDRRNSLSYNNLTQVAEIKMGDKFSLLLVLVYKMMTTMVVLTINTNHMSNLGI